MLVLAWGAHVISAATAAPVGKSAPPAASPSHFMLDSDTCLAPQEGLYAPSMLGAYSLVVRDLLLGDTGAETVLSVVVQPSFASPYSLRLEQAFADPRAPDAPRPYRLRLVRTKGHPWAEMMQEMHRQQGSVIHLGEADQKRALSATQRKTETKTSPVAPGLASRLVAVWSGALARTQYLTEIRETADGHHIFVEKADGTTYDFWHDDRGGTTHSPDKKSLLGDLTEIVETLTHYADAAPTEQRALLKQLDAKLDAFQRRLKRNEPCLHPVAPGKREG